MTTDSEAEASTTDGEGGRASPGRLASFFHRYLPIWRTVYVLSEQVASLRHQLAENQRRLADANRRLEVFGERIGLLQGDLERSGEHLRALEVKVDHAHERVSEGDQRIEVFGERVGLLQEDLERSGEHLRALEGKVGHAHERVSEGDQHLKALDNSIQLARRRSGQSDSDLLKLDNWYQDLQALHRGAPEAVLEVQKSYTAHFNERAWLQAAGPVVDLGCGRGEWLSLLAQEGWMTRGVDSSEEAVREARERGLDVELGDLVEFLETCPENSLSGVTAFQVIEHLPFGRIMALMHTAFRALIPGGILLLDTPNPENLQVSTYSFWLDPTHRHPIPPPLIMDLSYHVGFRDGSVLRKNPFPQWREQERGTSLEGEVAYRLYGPQDYALLAYKPAADAP